MISTKLSTDVVAKPPNGATADLSVGNAPCVALINLSREWAEVRVGNRRALDLYRSNWSSRPSIRAARPTPRRTNP